MIKSEDNTNQIVMETTAGYESYLTGYSSGGRESWGIMIRVRSGSGSGSQQTDFVESFDRALNRFDYRDADVTLDGPEDDEDYQV